MRVLLDTTAYSAFKRGHEGAAELIRRSREVIFSPVAAGEVLAGFRWGDRFQQNFDELRQFLDHPRVRLAPLTLETGDRYGRIYRALRRKGAPIPTNDMWIAAQAMETGAQLATLDDHFDQVDGPACIDLR